SEFQERMRAYFGPKAIIKLPESMAFGRDRLDSLTAAAQFGFDSFGASPHRQTYWRNMIDWHERARQADRAALFMPFPPPAVRPFAAPEEMLISAADVRSNCQFHGVSDS